MAEKLDKMFLEYEKVLQHEKKDVDDHRLAHHGDGGEYPPPYPYSSDSSHHFSLYSRHASKKPFLKLDVKFDLLMYDGECNVEKINNWIRQVEIYYQIQQFEEDETKIQLESLQMSGTTLVWWDRILQANIKMGNLLS